MRSKKFCFIDPLKSLGAQQVVWNKFFFHPIKQGRKKKKIVSSDQKKFPSLSNFFSDRSHFHKAEIKFGILATYLKRWGRLPETAPNLLPLTLLISSKHKSCQAKRSEKPHRPSCWLGVLIWYRQWWGAWSKLLNKLPANQNLGNWTNLWLAKVIWTKVLNCSKTLYRRLMLSKICQKY